MAGSLFDLLPSQLAQQLHFFEKCAYVILYQTIHVIIVMEVF